MTLANESLLGTVKSLEITIKQLNEKSAIQVSEAVQFQKKYDLPETEFPLTCIPIFFLKKKFNMELVT